jgi:hypothetical protein
MKKRMTMVLSRRAEAKTRPRTIRMPKINLWKKTNLEASRKAQILNRAKTKELSEPSQPNQSSLQDKNELMPKENL